jgi:hypothetical protein
MGDLLSRITGFVQDLAAGPVLQPKSVTVDPARCLPAESSGQEIIRDRCYLTLTINELFLSEARRWYTQYQPMVVVATTFLQGKTNVTVPAVVGPSLLEQPGQKLPQGLIINNIDVAGPIPYRGGTLTISVLLYRVQHTNHAKDLLKVVEGVSKAIGPAADLGMLTKVGGALMDGVGSLLSLGDTEPIMGQRFTMSPVGPGGMKTFYAALIGPETDAKLDSLSVESGKLRQGTGQLATDFNSDDYVLYSLAAPARRTDLSALPFYPLLERAKQTAFRKGDENWEAAKATFSEAWQQMSISPDLIPDQAEELFEEWKEALLKEKKRGEFMMMDPAAKEGPAEPDARTKRAASVLGL